MKVDIRDLAVFRELSHLDVIAYLSRKDWRQATVSDSFVVYRKSSHGIEVEVLVPLIETYTDYAEAIQTLVRKVSEAEEKSQLEVLSAIQTASFDVIRIRASDDDFADGSVPLEVGPELFEYARGVLVASALASENKRGAFGSARSERIRAFLKKSRMGQTERGSYVITMSTPIDPDLTTKDGQHSLGPEVATPFERTVTETLMRSLQAAKTALNASAISTDDKLKPFVEAVKDGVSANLLEAVAGVASSADSAETIVSVSWAATRAPEQGLPESVQFDKADVPILRSASGALRAREPKADHEIEGMVVGLESEGGDSPNFITVRVREDKGERRVRIQLEEEPYRRAIHAHESHFSVKVKGELAVEGGRSVLNGPRNFQVLEAPALEFEEETE